MINRDAHDGGFTPSPKKSPNMGRHTAFRRRAGRIPRRLLGTSLLAGGGVVTFMPCFRYASSMMGRSGRA